MACVWQVGVQSTAEHGDNPRVGQSFPFYDGLGQDWSGVCGGYYYYSSIILLAGELELSLPGD